MREVEQKISEVSKLDCANYREKKIESYAFPFVKFLYIIHVHKKGPFQYVLLKASSQHKSFQRERFGERIYLYTFITTHNSFLKYASNSKL